MSLCRRQAGIDIIGVGTETGLRLSARERLIEAVDERYNICREGGSSCTCVAVVLDNPES